MSLQSLRSRGVHAVLLHGMRGIGKKSLALDFAGATLCETPLAGGRACGQCNGCRPFETGNHPDFRFVVPDAMASLRLGREANEESEAMAEEGGASDEGLDAEPTRGKATRASREIRIDQIRALGSFAAVATHRGGARVILIAPAEAINTAAANALLKILEEPPSETLFLIVAETLDEVMPTIRSRCVLLRVEAPERSAAIEWLTAQGVADAEISLASVGGAPLAALEVAGGATMSPELRALLLDLLARGSDLSAAEVARLVPRDAVVGPVIDLMQRWCWDLLALRTGGRVRYHPQRQKVLAQMARHSSETALWNWADSLARSQASSEHPLNARLVIESALLEYVGILNERR